MTQDDCIPYYISHHSTSQRPLIQPMFKSNVNDNTNSVQKRIQLLKLIFDSTTNFTWVVRVVEHQTGKAKVTGYKLARPILECTENRKIIFSR